MTALQVLGYSNVRNLAGGISAWIGAGYEVVGGAAAAPAFDLTVHLNNFLTTAFAQGFATVSADNLFTEMLETAPFLLDVREVAEWDETGHIEGAINIPIRTLAQLLDELPADMSAPIVVYCKSGHRGAIAMTILKALGYTNVRNLTGGIGAWTDAGYEVVNDPVTPVQGAMPAIDPELVSSVDNYLTNLLPQGFGGMSVDVLSTELAETPPFLLDVREVSEWDEVGHIEGAINIPVRTLVENLDQLPADKSTPIVIYCASGHRGAIAMTVLQMLGYDVRNLSGGIKAWISAGYPVVGAAAVEIVMPEGVVLAEEDLQPIVMGYLENVPQGFASISSDTLAGELGDVFLVDVREPNEWEDAGYIEGAINIPVRTLTQNLYALPADKQAPIVVYCASGHRGALATMALNLLGYDNAVNLRGGIRAWPADQLQHGSIPALTSAPFPEVDADPWTTVDGFMANLPAGFFTISGTDFNLALSENPPAIVDVREPSEFDQGHVEGAVNIPTRSLGQHLGELPAKDAFIVMIGSSGQRSALTTMALRMLGYTNVRSLAGGFDALNQ